MMFKTDTLLLMSLPSINFLDLMVSEIYPGQNFKVKVIMAKSKVKSRSQHDDAYLHTHTHTHPPPTHTPIQSMSLSSINFLNLTVSEIQREQNLKGQGYYGKVKGQN